ncbi:putative dNA repair exonuclease SbcD [Mycobacterium xenopi 3993]|nr:putative dNA repair exonuclease SbcD [Mycobacterium xenopi 3993]
MTRWTRRRCTPAPCSPPNARATSSCSTGRCARGAPGPTTGRRALAVQGAHHRLGRRGARRLPDDGATRILVAHGGVDVLDPDPDKPSLIRLAALEDALARGAVHYVALGDKHSVTNVGGSGRVWYSGSPEVTNFDDVEADPGHVLVVDVDESDPQRTVAVDARRVGRWRFLTLRRQVDNSRDIADLDVNLDQLTDKDRTVVRLALTGSLTVTDRAALDACLDKYSRVFAWLGLWERHSELAVIPADGEFGDLGVGGFAAAAVDELVATARSGSGDAADDAQAALALLLRLADRGRGAA